MTYGCAWWVWHLVGWHALLEESHIHAQMDADEPTLLAEEAAPLWEITEEGQAFVEAHFRVALAPYDRDVGHEEEVDAERDVAGLVVLLVIALLTAVCAAYSLLMAAGVLGG
jgi:hypothetical protein